MFISVRGVDRLTSARLGRGLAVLAASAGLSGLCAVTGTAQAMATSPCGSSGVLSQSGTMVTCTYAVAGTEDTFSVPAGVSDVSVIAVGAAGGANANGVAGGFGAVVRDTALPVTPGAELWVDVGGPGAIGNCVSPSSGGFPDGGASVACSGGGGGSSALLTVSRSSATLTGDVANDSRLLAAGGGGGTGQGFFGASAGNVAVTGAGAGGCISDGGAGGVGPTDGTPGGGSGGCGGLTSYCFGTAGSATTGGVGSPYCHFGGGGGGGWFGGGGGGGLVGGAGEGGAGGGGGSSYGGAGPSTGTTIATASAGEAPQVSITYTVSSTDLTATLVSDSIGKGPGAALADRAVTIQSAVDGGDDAQACDDISNYLKKVATGNKLSSADVTQLTSDATNLSETLGC